MKDRPVPTMPGGSSTPVNLEMAAEPGLTLTIYTAAPGSRSEESLRLPASWAASEEEASAGATLPSD